MLSDPGPCEANRAIRDMMDRHTAAVAAVEDTSANAVSRRNRSGRGEGAGRIVEDVVDSDSIESNGQSRVETGREEGVCSMRSVVPGEEDVHIGPKQMPAEGIHALRYFED